MKSKEPRIVKPLPESLTGWRRRTFLSEVKHLADHSFRPRLIVDMTAVREIEPDSIDLLLECVEQMEHADGRVSVAGPSPEATVIFELTRLTSVLDVFPSVSEAMSGEVLPYPMSAPSGAQPLAA
jgi:anti-anti-sigma regulatory factor